MIESQEMFLEDVDFVGYKHVFILLVISCVHNLQHQKLSASPVYYLSLYALSVQCFTENIVPFVHHLFYNL